MNAKLSELKSKLSKGTWNRVEQLARTLVGNVNAVFEDIVWDAAGDKYGADFGGLRNEVSENTLWRILDEVMKDKQSVRDFEEKYFESRLQHMEKVAPEIVNSRLIEMIPDETLDRIIRLVNHHCRAQGGDGSRESIERTETQLRIPWPATNNLRQDSYSRDRVQEYVRGVLNPWIDEEEQKIKDQILPLDFKEKELQNEEATRQERVRAATNAANAEAYKKASEYKKLGEKIPAGKIATEVMHHFDGLIKRETGKVMKNHQKQLRKEWKDKRQSIRVGLISKFKKRKK